MKALTGAIELLPRVCGVGLDTQQQKMSARENVKKRSGTRNHPANGRHRKRTFGETRDKDVS
jgi:hypothetical protein